MRTFKDIEKEFYKEYKDGREKHAPQSFIHYFKARYFLFEELKRQKKSFIKLLTELAGKERECFYHNKVDYEEVRGYNSKRKEILDKIKELK